MIRSRSMFAGSTLAALVLGSSLALGTTAQAAPVQAVTSQPESVSTGTQSFTVNYNLLVPDAPVVFSVVGTGVNIVVGTGTTNSNGDVSFTYVPSGLAPGYYRLVASTSYGITSSIGFGVR